MTAAAEVEVLGTEEALRDVRIAYAAASALMGLLEDLQDVGYANSRAIKRAAKRAIDRVEAAR